METGFYHVGLAGLELLTSKYLPTFASQSAEITGESLLHRHFLRFVETGSHHVAQAHLELLGSSDPPASASHKVLRLQA